MGRTTMAFFERMGEPAPRQSFCRLYINNVYHGVYAIVESVDSDFLARTLDEVPAKLLWAHRLLLFPVPEELLRGDPARLVAQLLGM